MVFFLFDNLKIGKYPEVMKYQGQYPVIFLTLKEIRGKDFQEAFDRMKLVIKKLFESHSQILESDKISSASKNTFNNIVNLKATKFDFETSIQFLSEALYDHTGQKVIILLDEYDTPLHDAYVNNYYEEMRSFIASMFGKAFKGNNYLHKAIITVILKITKSSLFSELNNVEVYSCISSPLYGQYFGFTEKETVRFSIKGRFTQKFKST